MDAIQALRDGNLDEALSELQQLVRRDPANAKHRIFLFQVLCVLGSWDRALNQLEVLRDMDPGTLPMVNTYREALKCERLRADVFLGKRAPLVFGDPERWLALLLEALRLTGQGGSTSSRSVRDEALELAPATSGTVDGVRFEWIADADSRLGPLLEVIINGRYYWVPFHRVREIRIEPPEDLRDWVWMPAHFKWVNGGEAPGLVPTRYAGSAASDDPQIILARKTMWEESEPEVYVGLGQRMLATETGEFPLMDIREIVLDSQEGSEEDAAGSESSASDPSPLPETPHG